MSEFEEFARPQGFSGDFQRGCNGQYKSDLLHFMEKAFMHQQAKINDSENTRAVLYRENIDLRERNIELQKRIDVVLKKLEGDFAYVEQDQRKNFEFLQMAMIRCLKDDIKALRGERD